MRSTVAAAALALLCGDQAQPRLTPADIGQIVTVALDVSNAALRVGRPADVPVRALYVDVVRSNAAFVSVTGGRVLPIARAQWLPQTTFTERDLFAALNCPTPKRVTARCLVRVNGTVMHVGKVTPDTMTTTTTASGRGGGGGGASAAYVVLLNFYQPSTHPQFGLSGYGMQVRVVRQRARERWTGTLLYAIAG